MILPEAGLSRTLDRYGSYVIAASFCPATKAEAAACGLIVATLTSFIVMPFFFMLSGFILAHVYGPAFAAGTFSYRRFLVARLARLYPLHLAILGGVSIMVLGASVFGITSLLAKDFLKLVLLAILIASPVAWYFMNQWLAEFAYRIDMEWWMFVVAGVAAVGIAFLTIGFQSVKAALANPVKSLRSE